MGIRDKTQRSIYLQIVLFEFYNKHIYFVILSKLDTFCMLSVSFYNLDVDSSDYFNALVIKIK